MNWADRLSFRKGDFFAVFLVVVLIGLSAFVFFPRAEHQGAQVEIYQDGKLVSVCSLKENTTLTIQGAYTNVICIENGKAAVVQSDCPGGDCVHTGAVSSAGRSVVCLPNRVEIRITGSSPVDFVVR